MTRREYAFRRGLTWQLWENIAMVAAPSVMIIVMGFLGLEFWTTIVLALGFGVIAALIAWDRWWIFRNFAKRVLLDDDGIEAQSRSTAKECGWRGMKSRSDRSPRDETRFGASSHNCG